MDHPAMRYDMQSKELILAHCQYVSLPTVLIEEFGERTEYLDCSHNRLMNLTHLYEFNNLKYLILDNNRLHEAHFEQMQWALPKVKVLMLNRNELMDLQKTIQLLASIFPNLEYLSLHGNPICPDELELQPFCEYVDYEYEYYRSQISSAFGKLKFLDHHDLQRKAMSRSPNTSRHQRTPNRKFWPIAKSDFSRESSQSVTEGFTFGKLLPSKIRSLIQNGESEDIYRITSKDL
ncbi:PREDICTED: leucine-rich repeat-containing protein C10orf11 homolog isoform X1 [Bactrocera latifrons]|uniref:leucine-rich repeat-containing protein C10orf11 homolog isoform X1 n=1 Tax=Bactrocera latifrons TaxID=174628 RepID=UPI0008DCA078|nr:PREDICTED: leucine-rich repeat-containing protein C10orf11 homolog isoform X1 [Bactrocera latifrons]